MSASEQARVIVIAGPTASGKTEFAVTLARSLSGEIVNADSMQVYRGMNIGTAKPTPEEQKGIPHHLLDVVYPDEPFNAALYRGHALPVIRDITSRGRVCLAVGGAGLYIRALLGGLMKAPPADPAFREALQRECDANGPAALHARLAVLDPRGAAGIHPNDRVRIIRALEIVHLSGRRSSALMRDHRFGHSSVTALKFCINLDRDTLYHRIDARSERMMEQGLLEETRHLLNHGYAPDLKPMQSIGYRHMIRYIKGLDSLEEAVETLKRDTRRYAKRQITWFKAEADVIWIDPSEVNMVLGRCKAFLSQKS